MKKLSHIFKDKSKIELREDSFLIKKEESKENILHKKKKVNILALGDVGSTLLLGLKIMGGDIISSIGIKDLDEKNMERFEREINQIAMPFNSNAFPKVEKVKDIFDCDVFLFCATKGVPPVGTENVDVRLVQFQANKEIVKSYAKEALDKNYKGDFFIVSDPVDQLCKVAQEEGIPSEKIRGFGLGVMNGRALYYAGYDSLYKTEGRVFGPHGEDLVVANSIFNYDHNESKELTDLVTNSNIRMRELGFKPYIAPALSSGAISILELLRGNWHYSSLYFGEAFLGVKNKRTIEGDLVEDLFLDDQLFSRVELAYNNLKEYIGK